MHQRQVDAGAERAPLVVVASHPVSTKDHQERHDVSANLLIKLLALSSTAKMGCALAVGLAVVTTFGILQSSKVSVIFTTGELSPCQVFAFIICLTACFLCALFEGAALIRSEPIVFKRLILSEDSEIQLRSAAEFALYMMLFFACDRTSVVPREKKHYDKDTFWFLWLCLIIGALFTLRKAKPPKGSQKIETSGADTVASSPEIFHVAHLQRDQTEEWKGWMQVMFLWYHYFEVKPIYNVIRLYIAAYVWMTGFGNFSYYYVRKDFSLARFFQMQWRLNFMVIWVCAILANEYMLYYICMLHTFFTLLIYAGLGLFPHLNVTNTGVAIKFSTLALICFLLWDIDGVFEVVWKPFSLVVQYHDPYNATRPLLSEWQFRSYLDHYVWIVGMLCAFCHPRVDSWLEKLDAMPARIGNTIKGVVVGVTLVAGYWYVDNILLLPKKEYNNVHPYTSFIPILLFIVLRNIFQTARMYHLHLFEFLGKTTLETYIAQFHIWMATTGVNGSPKRLLRILPEGWPLVNFAVMSAIFFFVSYRLFQTTNTIKTIVLPAKASNADLKINVALFGALLVVTYVVALALKLLV